MLLNKFLVSKDRRIALSIFFLAMIVFVFTSDGHRHTYDEDVAYQQTLRLMTQEPHPLYVEGESRIRFEWPTLFPNPGPIAEPKLLSTTSPKPVDGSGLKNPLNGSARMTAFG